MPIAEPAFRQKQLSDALNAELSAGGVDLAFKDEILRSVLAGSGDCIKIIDLDGCLQFMSEGGKKVMEVEDFDVLKGCPWPDFWEGPGNLDAQTAIESAKAGGTARFIGAARTAKGTPRFWEVTVSPINDRDGRPMQILSISRDITVQHDLERRQTWLVNELSHRIKNVLTVVMSMVNQTIRGQRNYKEERQALSARLMALSAAQDILTQAKWASALVESVIGEALKPFQSGQSRINASGPDIFIGSKQAFALALIINELATNATKYGALSQHSGQVDINWTENGSREFVLTWHERGGPSVNAPEKQGFGSRLIKGLWEGDVGGQLSVTYAPDGLTCCLSTDAARLSEQ